MGEAGVEGDCSYSYPMADVAACPRGAPPQALPLSQWLGNVLAVGAPTRLMSLFLTNMRDRWFGLMI